MSFNLVSKVNHLEGITSYIVDNMAELAANGSGGLPAGNYYTSETCDATFARILNPAFAGVVSGIVETINDRTSAFKIKITKAVPAPSSTAPQPQALVALVVEIGARGNRDASGKWTPDPAHIAWIASLKPGKGITLDVSFSSKMNRLRIEKLPAAP